MIDYQLPADRPALMGILNVTPDSFSENGLHFQADIAIEAGLQMAHEGADIIDLGGESTRPGAASVDTEEEWRRVAPVLEKLTGAGLVVSIDTRKPEIAERALRAGAQIVNDVSGLRDQEMVKTCAQSGCYVCIMHMLGTPETMQINPTYGDVVGEISGYLLHQAEAAIVAGVAKNRIWIDPGIGFGKTDSDNLQLIRHLEAFAATGYPVLIGVSRKGFLGRLAGSGKELPITERLEASLAVQTIAQMKGARIIRAHDVSAARRAIEISRQIIAT
jgi:dihydropteroate synthase